MTAIGRFCDGLLLSFDRRFLPYNEGYFLTVRQLKCISIWV